MRKRDSRSPIQLSAHQNGSPSVVHDAVVAAAEALGERGRLIVASRKGPPPAFARSQMSGALTVIEPTSLRFDRDELHTLVAQRQLERLAEDRLDAIYELTGGWAAGLALILESGGLDESLGADLRRGTLFGDFVTEVYAWKKDDKVEVQWKSSGTSRPSSK